MAISTITTKHNTTKELIHDAAHTVFVSSSPTQLNLVNDSDKRQRNPSTETAVPHYRGRPWIPAIDRLKSRRICSFKETDGRSKRT